MLQRRSGTADADAGTRLLQFPRLRRAHVLVCKLNPLSEGFRARQFLRLSSSRREGGMQVMVVLSMWVISNNRTRD